MADLPAEGKQAVMASVCAAIGVGGKWLWDQLYKVYQDRKGEQAQQRKDLIDHLESMMRRLEEENAELDKRTEALRARIEKAAVRSATMLRHIRYLERLLASAIPKVDFLPWAEEILEEDTGTHRVPNSEVK
jgi:hypothetical protein